MDSPVDRSLCWWIPMLIDPVSIDSPVDGFLCQWFLHSLSHERLDRLSWFFLVKKYFKCWQNFACFHVLPVCLKAATAHRKFQNGAFGTTHVICSVKRKGVKVNYSFSCRASDKRFPSDRHKTFFFRWTTSRKHMKNTKGISMNDRFNCIHLWFIVDNF